MSDQSLPLAGVRRISLWLAWIGGGGLIGAAFLVSADVVCRKWFNVSLGGADEISGYVFGAATALAMPHALLERAHIRIDILYRRLPRRMRIAADMLGLLLLFGFVLVIVRMAGGLYLDTLSHGSRSITPLRIPLAIPQTFWFAGWLLTACVCFLLIYRLSIAIVRGDRRAASGIAGMRGEEEERTGGDSI